MAWGKRWAENPRPCPLDCLYSGDFFVFPGRSRVYEVILSSRNYVSYKSTKTGNFYLSKTPRLVDVHSGEFY